VVLTYLENKQKQIPPPRLRDRDDIVRALLNGAIAVSGQRSNGLTYGPTESVSPMWRDLPHPNGVGGGISDHRHQRHHSVSAYRRWRTNQTVWVEINGRGA